MLFWVALLTLLFYLLVVCDLTVGNRMIKALREVSPLNCENPLRISIVVAARNEQKNIREALQSLLELDYPAFELIVVDDRSEDNTGQILDEMAASSSRLKVIHLKTLPPGWLGKNHALWIGSRLASGELLLFTDADIVMESTVLTRAAAFMELYKLDHLTATPSMTMPTTFLSMFGASFIIFFALFSRPWKARDVKSRCHVGIGAFNIVRAEIYRHVGGHETIRLRPDDDMKLGKIIKLAGYRQDLVYAPEFLAVEWYSTIKEVIKGLEKNAFSAADYNIPLVLAGILIHLFCSLWPFIAIFITTGVVQDIYLATVCFIIIAFADSARFHHTKVWYVLGYPIATALFVFILFRTMLLNLVQGGIYWRGTFYPLKELKANKV